MCFLWALAQPRPSAVRVWIRSRSTSAKPANTASINRPVLVPVSAQGSATDVNNDRTHRAFARACGRFFA